MQRNIAVGISLPKDIMSEIDEERGDVPRSKYISRILERTYTVGKLRKRINQDSLDRRNKRSFKKNIKRLNRSIIENALDKTEDIETALYVLTVHQLSAILDRDCKGKDLTIPVVVSGCRLHNKENCGCGDIEDRYFNGYPGRPELVLETLKKYDIVDEVATLNDISFLFPSK